MPLPRSPSPSHPSPQIQGADSAQSAVAVGANHSGHHQALHNHECQGDDGTHTSAAHNTHTHPHTHTHTLSLSLSLSLPLSLSLSLVRASTRAKALTGPIFILLCGAEQLRLRAHSQRATHTHTHTHTQEILNALDKWSRNEEPSGNLSAMLAKGKAKKSPVSARHAHTRTHTHTHTHTHTPSHPCSTRRLWCVCWGGWGTRARTRR